MMDALFVAGVFALMIYSWQRGDLRRLRRDFAAREAFDGLLEPCLVSFVTAEAKSDCLIGCNPRGLYLASTPEVLARNRWWQGNRRYGVIATPLFIPWTSLECRPGRWPMRNYLYFRVPSNKAGFFVPREIGVALLMRAGRQADAN